MTQKDKIKITVCGALGRMGSNTLALLQKPEFQDMALQGAIVKESSKENGKICQAGVSYASDPRSAFANSQVIIDYSDAIERHCTLSSQVPAAYITGTTDLPDSAFKALKLAARHCPVLWAENFSLGAYLAKDLSGRLAKILASQDAKYDIDILDSHHCHKRDAPSGTAIKIAEEISKATNLKISNAVTGKRNDNDIVVTSQRLGGVIGRHDIIFSSQDEQITISHNALSRSVFAAGALRLARKLIKLESGFYEIKDLLKVV